jgi:hypothetical protein
MDPLASMTASEVKFCGLLAVSRCAKVFVHWATHLGSDELETGELTPCLILDDLLDLRVGLGKRGVEALVL